MEKGPITVQASRTYFQRSESLRSGRRDYTLRMAVISFLRRTGYGQGRGGGERQHRISRRQPRRAEAFRGLVPCNEKRTLQSLESAFHVWDVSSRNSSSYTARTHFAERQHNCAIVFDLPPNLEPRVCLDSRVFGGKRVTPKLWILRDVRANTVVPWLASEQHIGAFGPCAITFSVKFFLVPDKELVLSLL